MKYLYVSSTQGDLIKGKLYTLKELSKITTLPIKKIQHRIMRESTYNNFCKIVTEENLRKSKENQFFKYNSIETPVDFLNDKYLRRAL